jgi:hypothetical protein
MGFGGVVASLVGKKSSAEELAQVYIVPLNSDGGISPVGDYPLQYWPDSITWSNSPGWASKTVHGGSHPLYQWFSGGERVLSFNAEFSRDLQGEIVGKSLIVPPGSVPRDRYNVDIVAAVQWLESLGMGRYQAFSPGGVDPPPTLYVVIPNSGIGRTKGGAPSDYFQSVMVGCNPTIDAWFPDGTPRHATVALSFAEVAQSSDGIVWADRKRYERGKAGGQKYGVPIAKKV